MKRTPEETHDVGAQHVAPAKIREALTLALLNTGVRLQFPIGFALALYLTVIELNRGLDELFQRSLSDRIILVEIDGPPFATQPRIEQIVRIS